jgi:hypothetical protein
MTIVFPCREKINEFYQDDAKSVHGLNVRPSVGEWNSKVILDRNGRS